MSTRVRSTRDRLIRTEPFETFHRPQRSRPARILGLLIRLRAELLVLALALTCWVWLVNRMPTWAAGTVLGAAVLVVLLWPGSRRYVLRRGWAVMTRHRIRTTFVERRVMNYSGNVPLLLWARPSAAGEQVLVLLRAGIDAHDLELAASFIAVSCVASDVRITPHRRLSAFVLIEVIRRDPLTGPAVVSPLTRVAPAFHGAGHA
ncbi:hypothetical protein GCM10009836_51410 [Pseudonocardia ailaonensis]|uniref:DUF304 domain-containing protein n=1 Tax=Pseudonocardia ailaonensis TaxID=367279 RepID=A0ABN2NDT1_9PSEU